MVEWAEDVGERGRRVQVVRCEEVGLGDGPQPARAVAVVGPDEVLERFVGRGADDFFGNELPLEIIHGDGGILVQVQAREVVVVQ